jgi:hypothetical protein
MEAEESTWIVVSKTLICILSISLENYKLHSKFFYWEVNF